MSIMDDLGTLPDKTIAMVDEYWEYWWILGVAIVGFGVYVIWFV